MKRSLVFLASAMLLAGAVSAQTKDQYINENFDAGWDAWQALQAKAALASGVPEDVVRNSFPMGFKKEAKPTGPASETTNCDLLANSQSATRQVAELLRDEVEPLNAANDLPNQLRPANEKDFYLYLRDVYERGNVKQQVKVQTSFNMASAELRDYLKDGISCQVAYTTTMNGTIRLNQNWRGRQDDGPNSPVINVNYRYLTIYEVKGQKTSSGTQVSVRGLKRMFPKS